mmetsp:Transcript_2492/g.3448  ORF Transcript_2492/g.3448 Transcript_2492/m.3448 type:complete len:96 (+) Transcript_2492:985-1272(+)
MPTPRAMMGVSPINDREIVILGGENEEDIYLRDVLILDTVNRSIRVAIEDVGYGMAAFSAAPGFMTERGVMIALMGRKKDDEKDLFVSLLRYDSH